MGNPTEIGKRSLVFGVGQTWSVGMQAADSTLVFLMFILHTHYLLSMPHSLLSREAKAKYVGKTQSEKTDQCGHVMNDFSSALYH